MTPFAMALCIIGVCEVSARLMQVITWLDTPKGAHR